MKGFYLVPGWAEFNGKGVYRGENPPEGALFTVWVKEFTGDEIKIAITNAAGQPVANLKAAGHAGIGAIELGPASDQRCSDRIWRRRSEEIRPERRVQRGTDFRKREDETEVPCRYRGRNSEHAEKLGLGIDRKAIARSEDDGAGTVTISEDFCELRSADSVENSNKSCSPRNHPGAANGNTLANDRIVIFYA